MANGSNEISTRSGDNKGFIHAVMNEDFEAVAYYVSIGMDVNFLDPEIMTTPLIEAVRLNNHKIVKKIMDHGGDPNLTSQLGESANSLAVMIGDKDLKELIGYKDYYLSRFISFWKKIFS